MELKKQAHEIAQAIIAAIINGEYKFIDTDSNITKLQIDGTQFELWTGGGLKHLKFWQQGLFLDNLEFTPVQAEAVWDKLQPDFKHYGAVTLKAKKQAKIAELEAELAELDKLTN